MVPTTPVPCFIGPRACQWPPASNALPLCLLPSLFRPEPVIVGGQPMRVLSVVKCQQGEVKRQDGRRDVVTYYTFEDQVGNSFLGQWEPQAGTNGSAFSSASSHFWCKL